MQNTRRVAVGADGVADGLQDAIAPVGAGDGGGGAITMSSGGEASSQVVRIGGGDAAGQGTSMEPTAGLVGVTEAMTSGIGLGLQSASGLIKVPMCVIARGQVPLRRIARGGDAKGPLIGGLAEIIEGISHGVTGSAGDPGDLPAQIVSVNGGFAAGVRKRLQPAERGAGGAVSTDAVRGKVGGSRRPGLLLPGAHGGGAVGLVRVKRLAGDSCGIGDGFQALKAIVNEGGRGGTEKTGL